MSRQLRLTVTDGPGTPESIHALAQDILYGGENRTHRQHDWYYHEDTRIHPEDCDCWCHAEGDPPA